MSIRNGQPYIPPEHICPVGRDGDEFTIAPDMFHFVVAQGVRDDPYNERLTDIAGLFDPDTDGDSFIGTGIVEVPRDSPLAQAAEIIDTHPDRERLEHRAGQILCDRVVYCRGIVSGDCWALGDDAMVGVVRQVVDELKSDES